MTTHQRYSVTPQPVETILAWIKSREIAIPEIQRPFVWEATKVRNLLDSLYRGFPVGYLIAWRSPSVRLKDGTRSAGKRILIDGQQRVTALMAALLGEEVLTKNYATVRIRIAFHPVEGRFEVSNPAIRKDPAWIPDISIVFAPNAGLFEIAERYLTANPEADRGALYRTIESVRRILSNQVGVIELAEDLDIETVTEIFIRVNSAGVSLNQADFAMSKIAANEAYGGNELRKTIDYFCRLAVDPDFLGRIQKNDALFASSDLMQKMSWLKDAGADIYDPSYTDVLRVAFTTEFGRGKLQDLVALLSGRNFETREFEEAVAEESFGRLRKAVAAFMNETHFKRLVMILRSAGFIHKSLVGSQNAINFAYILYLRARVEGVPPSDIERMVRRWYVMSLLRGRYVGNFETRFDSDIRHIERHGTIAFTEVGVAAELSEGFWTTMLPRLLETSSINSPYFHVFQAAQVKQNNRGFLSRDITVQDLILNRKDVHHIYPRHYLKGQGYGRGSYNQIANYAIAQSEINIAIGAKSPSRYFRELQDQCLGGPAKYGGLESLPEALANLHQHCIPASIFEGLGEDYDAFLRERRVLMAEKIHAYFNSL
jgi:hypothetical protein